MLPFYSHALSKLVYWHLRYRLACSHEAQRYHPPAWQGKQGKLIPLKVDDGSPVAVQYIGIIKFQDVAEHMQ